MTAPRHRASAPTFITRTGEESVALFAVTEFGFRNPLIEPSGGWGARARREVATDSDVNPLITSPRLNGMETRLFHDLFAAGCRDAIFTFGCPVQESLADRPMQHVLSDRAPGHFADGVIGRRAG